MSEKKSITPTKGKFTKEELMIIHHRAIKEGSALPTCTTRKNLLKMAAAASYLARIRNP